MKNKALAAAAAAAIGFSVSSLVAPGIASAWPGTCLPFVGCVAIPVDPHGAIPGVFGGLPNGLPGLPAMPAMPAIAAPPPVVAPPVIPAVAPPVIAPPVVAPPVVAPPVIPAAAPPVIAPPVVAPPVIPAAAPVAPSMPNMTPLEHTVEGMLNAPAPAAPVAPSMPNMTPLEHTVEGMLNAPPPAAPTPPSSTMPNMSPLEHTVEGMLNPSAPTAPAPAAPASAPVPGAAPAPAPNLAPGAAPAAPAPLAEAAPAPTGPLDPPQEIVGPNGAVNMSTLPQAEGICRVTGACNGLTPEQTAKALGGSAQPGAPAPAVEPAAAPAPAPAPEAAQFPSPATNSGAVPAAPAPSSATGAPASGTAPTDMNYIPPGLTFPIGCEDSTAFIGNPACNTAQGIITPGSDSGREMIAKAEAGGGGPTTAPASAPAPSGTPLGSIPGLPPGGIPQNINGEQGVSADCAYAGYAAQYGDFCAATYGSGGSPATPAVTPAAAPPATPAVPVSAPPENCWTEGICAGPPPDGTGDGIIAPPSATPLGDNTAPAPDAPPPAPAPDAPPAPDAAPPPADAAAPPDPNAAPPPADSNTTDNANNDDGSQCTTQGMISGQPDRVVLVSIVLVDNPNPTPNECVPRGRAGGLGPEAQTADPNNSALGVLNTPGANNPYDLCNTPGAAANCAEATHNSQQVKPTDGQTYGGATYSADCGQWGSCWRTPNGDTTSDPRPILPGGEAVAAPIPPAAAPAPSAPAAPAPSAPAVVPPATPTGGTSEPDYGPPTLGGTHNSPLCHMLNNCVPLGQ
jgi:hypothetical protein